MERRVAEAAAGVSQGSVGFLAVENEADQQMTGAAARMALTCGSSEWRYLPR